jgi:hypothetical protein
MEGDERERVVAMPSEIVLQNLTEPAEHFERVMEAARTNNDAAMEAWIVFVYRKLNCAWNSRDLPLEEALEVSTLEQRCRFPLELADSVAE